MIKVADGETTYLIGMDTKVIDLKPSNITQSEYDNLWQLVIMNPSIRILNEPT